MGSTVTRDRLLAYRFAAHELHRPDTAAALAVLDLGVQDSPPGSAALALAARRPPRRVPSADDPAITLAWSIRGAPHLHRTKDLIRTAAAVWPLDDADAESRLGTSGRSIRKAGIPGLTAFRLAAEALHAVVVKPTTKGEASGAVTRRLPDALAYDCKPCGARHVYGSLFQAAAFAGGVRLERAGASTMLAPIPRWPGLPKSADPAPLVLAYLALMGPSTQQSVAAFLDMKPATLARVWPADLVEVTVDGIPSWASVKTMAAIRSAPQPDGVRLLPPSDPFLQGRDRELLVPQAEHRKALWRAINSPGAVLANGEIVGFWQGKGAGKAYDVNVTGFAALPPRSRTAIETEAQVVAAVRGAAQARVTFA